MVRLLQLVLLSEDLLKKLNNMQLIVGLGNPGKKYEYTRHNAGFMAIDYLAKKISEETWHYNKKFDADIIKNSNLILAKPYTFMNKSGESVERILSFYGLLPKKFGIIKKSGCDISNILTIIHDDLDLDIGKYKLSINSGSAGNKGVGSVIQILKTKNFNRYRIGINSDVREKRDTEKFVLQKFTQNERELVESTINEISETIINKSQ